MKFSNVYSQLKNNFKIISKDINTVEIKRILRICVYVILIIEM